ncbi:MAG: hypothetical protein WEB06_17520 [Actinomycetota bacterium]
MRRVALAALVLAGLLVQAHPAAACTCGVRSLPEQIEAASVVFTGTVSGIKPASEGELSVAFDVSARYKGDVGRRVTVATALDGAECGVPFAAEATYVVFGAGEANALSTGICNGTTDDVAVLAGLSPLETFAAPNGDLPGDEPGSRSLPIGTAAGLVTLVLAGSIWAWMMRVRPPRPLA